MKKTKMTLLTAALSMSVILLFTGCFPEMPLTKEQKRWVRQLEEDYPDDSFTVVGHSIVSMGVRSPSCVSVASENFPGEDIQLYMNDGELYSNYPRFYHEEAVNEYFSDMVIDCFGCDDVEIDITDTTDKPLEYMDDEEYIEEYAVHHFTACLYYEDDHDYPDEDEIISLVLDYLSQIHTDGERGNLINFTFCRSGVGDPVRNRDMEYQVSLHEGITGMRDVIENRFIYRDEELEDMLDTRD